jgi:hypothetical protein
LSNLRFTELHYNPAAFAGVADRQDMEFIELFNTGSQTVGLGGVQIAGFDDSPYVFPAGLMLGAKERIIVPRNAAVFESVYGSGFNVASTGYSPRNLSNSGEQITLLGPSDEVLQSVSFGDLAPWPTAPDGNGPSLEIIDPLGNQGDAANWRASAFVGGSPGSNGMTGDYDDDGIVTDADRLRWRASFGMSVPRGTGADGNRDGVVDAADYVDWRNAMTAPMEAAEVAAASAAVDLTPAQLLDGDIADIAREASYPGVYIWPALAESLAISSRSARVPSVARVKSTASLEETETLQMLLAPRTPIADRADSTSIRGSDPLENFDENSAAIEVAFAGLDFDLDRVRSRNAL